MRPSQQTWSDQIETDSFSKFTPGKRQFYNMTKSEHPVLLRPDSGLCAIAHLLQKARILLPRRSLTKCLLPSTRLDSRTQDVSAKQNKYSHIWREHVLHSPLTTLGCKIKGTLKRPQNMKLQRCTFAESMCRIFNHPGDLNLIFFSFGQSICTELLSTTRQGIK